MIPKSWADVDPPLWSFMANAYGIPNLHNVPIHSSGDVIITCRNGKNYRLGYFMDTHTFAHENPAYRCKRSQTESKVQYDYFISFRNGELTFSSNIDGIMFSEGM